ncbi:unnamed protein product [Brachionus calyciflorus]|uniref:Uncharacterized protein n=1 Tax=Brachionus calyciflorus TaxID=104777 RepID=A0A814C5X2_9BILA|nr:unnamed protein product [Brachionus calyciflorus]
MVVKFFKKNKLWIKYNNYVQKYPLIGISITSAFGMGAGNAICQSLMYKKTKNFSYFEIGQYTSYGFLFGGPYMKYWWYALELKIFKNPKTFLRPH